MQIKSLLLPALAGLALLSTARAAAITENFAADPLQNGWQIFGDTNLFQWDPARQVLDVTWDSSQPNSYFYHPLGTILGTNDDFSMSFDLYLTDYAAGGFAFQLAAGMQNFGEATNSDFLVGTGCDAPDLAEFDFFPATEYITDASVDPTFVDSENTFAYTLYGYVALPVGIVMQVSLSYTAANQTAVLTITTNGVAVVAPSYSYLFDDTYGTFADYHLDTFAVESYSGAESGSWLLAHGTIGNILLVTPPPPVAMLQVTMADCGAAQVCFGSLTTWNYVLQSSADLKTWRQAGPTVAGTGGSMTLQATNSPPQQQFYRVCALRED
jgi:hypothetical protein